MQGSVAGKQGLGHVAFLLPFHLPFFLLLNRDFWRLQKELGWEGEGGLASVGSSWRGGGEAG